MEAFPGELARILVAREEQKLRLVFPAGVTLDNVLALAGDGAFGKARKALSEFDSAVKRELSRQTILDKKAAIDAVWDETKQALEGMKQIAKADKWYQWCLSMGVVGAVAFSLAGFPGLLSLLGASVALDKIIKPQPATTAFGSFPLALYELERTIEKKGD
jgi:hypothetical protein